MKNIKAIIKEEILNLNENEKVINKILDKINRKGVNSLSVDEKNYFDQLKNNNVNKNLEGWLLSDDEDTFDINGNKLLYNEFTDDENIFYSNDKLKRVISNAIKKNPNSYSSSADWGSATVWSINSKDNHNGTFIYFDYDDQVVLLNRQFDEDTEQNDDEVIMIATNAHSLYELLKTAIKMKK